MVGFDLSEILMESGLTTGISKIQDLSYQLSTQTTGYISNIQNLKDGRKPKEGQFIQELPATLGFVADTILNLRNLGDIYLAKMYSDQVFELMVGSGYIPVAWLHKNYPDDASVMLGTIKNLWDAMLTDYAGMNVRRDFIYTKFRSFGMFTCKMAGYSKERLLYFLVPNGSIDGDFLNSWILENGIHEVVVMNDNEYASFLMNPNYTFLFKFDKTIDVMKGITFVVSTDLKAAVPSYMAQIGCDKMCFFPNKEDGYNYSVKTNRYLVRDFQRGETLQITVSLPDNHIIDFVSINGIPYFFGTADMQAAGIMITENDAMLFTSYKTYNVTISGLRESAKIYIDACEDMTGRQTTKKMINTQKSTAVFGDADAKISIVFNNPFIFFNSEKVKVYARKDASSDEELIAARDIVMDGYNLVARKSVFGTTTFADMGVENQNFMGMDKPWDSPWNPDPAKKHDNPFIISYLPSPAQRARRLANEVSDVNPEARVILFNVTECGNIIITFDGYTDYKFFRVAFENRAMVAVLRVAGHVDDIDIVPVIEDFEIVNPNVTEEIQSNEPSEEGGGGEDVNGTDTPTGDDSNPNNTTDNPGGGEENPEESKEENSTGEREDIPEQEPKSEDLDDDIDDIENF